MTMSLVVRDSTVRSPPKDSVLIKDAVRGWRVESMYRPRATDRKISVAYVRILDRPLVETEHPVRD